MAAKKDDGKSEINYVASQNFMKENYQKVYFDQLVKWPEEWGYIVPLYREMYETLAKGNRTQIPEKVLRVKEETFADFESKLGYKRPLPSTHTKMYGWKTGSSIAEHIDKWIEPRPYISMYKILGWGVDSQH